jgi:hypothetical protein
VLPLFGLSLLGHVIMCFGGDIDILSNDDVLLYPKIGMLSIVLRQQFLLLPLGHEVLGLALSPAVIQMSLLG